jgi:uncharacterized protein (DUF2225 family)
LQLKTNLIIIWSCTSCFFKTKQKARSIKNLKLPLSHRQSTNKTERERKKREESLKEDRVLLNKYNNNNKVRAYPLSVICDSVS